MKNPVRKRVVELPAAGPRAMDAARASVEDAVSAVMLQLFAPEIGAFVRECNADLAARGDALLYAHGSFALAAYMRDHPLLNDALALVGEAEAPVLHRMMRAAQTPPRDLDLVVVRRTPASCSTARTCSADDVNTVVARHMRVLRRTLHDRIRETHASFLDAVRAALRSDKPVELLNSEHFYVERKDGAGGGARLVMTSADEGRGSGRGRGRGGVGAVCTPANMPALDAGKGAGNGNGKGCYPLRDSFNMTLDFETQYDTTAVRHAFNLRRLTVVLRVQGRRVPVNFLDVSLLEAEDHKYQRAKLHARMAERVSSPPAGADAGEFRDIAHGDGVVTLPLVPYPDTAYMLDNTLVQLSDFLNRARTLGTADDRAVIALKIDKLRSRAALLCLLHAIEAYVERGRGGAFNISHCADTVHKQLRDELYGLLSSMLTGLQWYTNAEAADVLRFAMKGAFLARYNDDLTYADALVRASNELANAAPHAPAATRSRAPAVVPGRAATLVAQAGGGKRPDTATQRTRRTATAPATAPATQRTRRTATAPATALATQRTRRTATA